MIDAIGLCPESEIPKIDYEISIPHYFTNLDETGNINQFPDIGIILGSWQDDYTKSVVSFNGLLDHQGRPKKKYFEVKGAFSSKITQIRFNPIHILKPAIILNPGSNLKYTAIHLSNKKWNISDPTKGNIYEWYLIKVDSWGNARDMNYLGNGSTVNITIPEHPEFYKLYLISLENEMSNGTFSTLNTPLAY
jgi:hypothetical protein